MAANPLVTNSDKVIRNSNYKTSSLATHTHTLYNEKQTHSTHNSSAECGRAGRFDTQNFDWI